MKRLKTIVAASIALVLASTPAQAGLITMASDPALTGATLIDFDGEALASFPSTTIDTVTFSAAAGFLLQIDVFDAGGTYGGSGRELSTQFTNLRFDITFATTVSAFAMNWGGANENWTVSLFNTGGSPIETLTFLGGDPGKGATYIEYYGAAASGIKSVSLIADVADWVKIDAFRFVPESAPTDPAAVPEPGTLILFGTGLAAVVAHMKRRRVSAS